MIIFNCLYNFMIVFSKQYGKRQSIKNLTKFRNIVQVPLSISQRSYPIMHELDSRNPCTVVVKWVETSFEKMMSSGSQGLWLFIQFFFRGHATLHLPVSVYPSVRPSVRPKYFWNCERFSHYCSCPTVRDWIAVYPVLFILKFRHRDWWANGQWRRWLFRGEWFPV